MAVKRFRCKSWLWWAYWSWLSKVSKQLRKGVVLFTHWKGFALFWNIDIVILWLNYRSSFLEEVCVYCFLASRAPSHRNAGLLSARIGTAAVGVGLVWNTSFALFETLQLHTPWSLHSSGTKLLHNTTLQVRQCQMEHIYNNKPASHLLNFPTEFKGSI